MLHNLRPIILFTAFLMPLASAFAQRLEDLRLSDFLPVESGAYVLLKPEPITQADQATIGWSPDGAFMVVAVARETATPGTLLESWMRGPGAEPPDVNLVVWEAQTRRAKDVMTAPGQLIDIQWFPSNRTAAFALDEIRQVPLGGTQNVRATLYLLNASSGVALPIVQKIMPFSNGFSVTISPSSSYGAVYFRENLGLQGDVPTELAGISNNHLLIFNENGRVVQDVRPKYELVMPTGQWSADGSSVLLEHDDPTFDRPQYMKVDVLSGSMAQELRPESYLGRPNIPDSGWTWYLTSAKVPNGSGQRLVKMLHIGQEDADTNVRRRLFVASGVSEFPSIAPNGQNVAYVANGTLSVRQILKLDPDQYKAVRAKVEQVELTERARQIVLAAVRYAYEHQGVLPKSSTWRTDLASSLVDVDTDEFVWSYSGPSDSRTVQNPENAVVGYIEGQSGRVTAFLDAHVRWVAKEQ